MISPKQIGLHWLKEFNKLFMFWLGCISMVLAEEIPCRSPWIPTLEVRMRVDPMTRQRFTAREWRDQQRDWLLLTATVATLQDADRLNKILVDWPTMRLRFLKSLADWDFGVSRSVQMDDRTILALLPAGLTVAQRMNQLARIADTHRMRTGEIPEVIQPFEYRLTDDYATTLIQTLKIAGHDLFKPANGYLEMTVRTSQDLNAFLHRIDDLVMVERTGKDSLTLGGRKLQDASRMGVLSEDVATLWQAEQALSKAGAGQPELLDSLGFSLDPVLDFEALSRFYEVWLAPLLLDMLRESATISVQEITAVGDSLRQGKEEDFFVLMQKIAREKNVAVDFPAPFYVKFLKFFDYCASTSSRVPVEQGQNSERDAKRIAKFRHSIAQHGLARISQEITACVMIHHQFQIARYDGALQGTEVGMSLFYTDLLAKLWGLDHGGVAPTRMIEEFFPMTRSVVSPIFKAEIQQAPNTRLWFGPLTQGWQTWQDDNKLLFARNVTRVYAASSDPLFPGHETEPNAVAQTFLGWLNDHYEEIAHFEPEYQRLDAIMKWSLAIGWLSSHEEARRLDFLQDFSVDHSAWFPEWVKNRPGVSQKAVLALQFHPAGFRGSQTEALPILKSESFSQFGGLRYLSGGVSLGGKSLFKPSSSAWDGYVPPQEERQAGGLVEVPCREEVICQLAEASPSQAGLTVTPRHSVRFRSRSEEIPAQAAYRTLYAKNDQVEMELNVGQISAGQLTITGGQDDFLVEWRSGELLLGQDLARRMSLKEEPVDALRKHPGVTDLIALQCGRCILVKLSGASRWLHLEPEPIPSVTLEAGWDGRVADPKGEVVMRMAWLDEEQVRTILHPS